MYRLRFIDKIFFSLKIILLFPIVLLIVVLYPFFKIKIFEIETRLLGHFTQGMEIFLCELELGFHKNSNCLFLWVPNKNIANKFIYKKWKEKIVIVPEFIFGPVLFFFRYFDLKPFLIPYRHWTKNFRGINYNQNFDKFEVLTKCKPRIVLSNTEIKIGKNFLTKINFKENDKFVCFFSRDSKYHYSKNNFQNNSIRNSSISNQVLSMKYLSEKNYKIFRMGRKVIEHLPYINNNIIDYANSEFKSDFLDFFLLTRCQFMVSTGSGIDSVPLLNRKKVLLINFSKFDALNYYDNTFYPFFIPKKFKFISTNKFVPYSEVFEKKFSKIEDINILNKMGYDIEDNSDFEILEAVKTMEIYVSNNTLNTHKNYPKDKFNDMYFKFFNYKLKNINICKDFLSKNKDLIM